MDGEYVVAWVRATRMWCIIPRSEATACRRSELMETMANDWAADLLDRKRPRTLTMKGEQPC